MTLTELICDGLLIQAISLVGIVIAGEGGASQEAPRGPSASPRERLRKEHNVRELTSAEEGCGAAKLPSGVYGFTSSPMTESPLFAVPMYRSFEVHKTLDAECRLICFVTPEEAAAIQAGGQAVEVHLYPEAYDKATELLAIPYSRLTAKKLVTSREPGNWAGATVFPLD